MLTQQLSPSRLAVRPFNGAQLPPVKCRHYLTPRRQVTQRQQIRAGIELDWSDPDTLTGAFGALLGIAVGIGAPLFYISRDNADDKRLSDLRELNRQNYKETGKYLSEVGGAIHIPLHVKCGLACLISCFPCNVGRNKSHSTAQMDGSSGVPG